MSGLEYFLFGLTLGLLAGSIATSIAIRRKESENKTIPDISDEAPMIKRDRTMWGDD